MGIHRSKETGQYVAQCDQCLDVVDFDDGEEFEEVKAAIDADKWKTVRAGNSWRNICPDCQ